jgi:leucyl aminopeptidase
MNVDLLSAAWADLPQLKTDTLLVTVCEDFKPADLSSNPISAAMSAALAAKDWSASAKRCLSLYGLPGVAARRVVLVGIGKGSAKEVAQALTDAWALAKGDSVQNLSVALLSFQGAAQTAESALQDAVSASAQALWNASYVYTASHGKGSKVQPRKLKKVSLLVDQKALTPALKNALKEAQAIAAGVELAKECGNRPANYATPTHLASVAQQIVKTANNPKLTCEVLGPKEVAKLGMGSFMAVAQGADEPLRFIVLNYQGAAKTQAPTVLVGKGITFDTGGISLKPGPEMDEMKFDMCGAASVLGCFQALALLKPKLNVVGLIPACENMPSGRATRPGDVVTSMSGQTIEILNTDAEGRLVLCDALTYAERFKPKAVIDIATLTGACVIALGAVRSGLFSSNEALAQSLQKAGDQALDPCWRMPLDEDYAVALKSNFADVANIGGRPAGSVTAAKFLQRFTEAYPWAHLDIAGTAWKSGAAKGATGRPVGLLMRHLLAQA